MKSLTGIFICLCMMLKSPAQAVFTVVKSTRAFTELSIRFPEATYDSVYTPWGLAARLRMPKAVYPAAKGFPDLPQYSISLHIPEGSEGKIEFISATYQDQSNRLIAPSKGKLTRTQDPRLLPYVFGSVYSQHAWYPEAPGQLHTPYTFRDLRGQTLHISPVLYHPADRTLRIYSELHLRIHHVADSFLENANQDNPTYTEVFEGIYKNHFINYQRKRTRYSPVNDLGKMLVLCPGKYLTEIAPFIKWKEQKGIQTFLVNTDTLSGGLLPANISTLVKGYYQQNQIAYLLLVGDDTDIPPVSSATLVAGPSDIAYAYISNNDHYPEFSVGRFSGETPEQIRTQVQRTLDYEKTPNTTGNWMSTQIGVASGQGPGDDNQYDFEHIHDIVDSNKQHYLYLQNVEMFDDTCTSTATLLGTDLLGYPTNSELRDAINQGASLLNYTGHGNSDGILTTGFSSADVPGLNNLQKLPFVFTVGCRPGSFTGYTCFAEHMQRAESTSGPYGSIACFMSTIDQYWDEPMQAQDEFNAIMRGARPSNHKQRLGPTCVDACASMNDKYNTFADPTGGSDMTDTWVFFGDPSISLFTRFQGNLSISYNTHIQQNATFYEVHCPVDGTQIGLYYQGKFLASSVAYGGIAYFNFPALSVLDTVYITATRQNYTPAFGKAIVVNWPNSIDEITEAGFQIYPNPATSEFRIESSTNRVIQRVKLIHPNGQSVYAHDFSPGQPVRVPVDQIPSGFYLIEIQTEQGLYHKPFIKP